MIGAMPRKRRIPHTDDPHKPIDPRKPFTMAEAKATVKGGPGARRTMIRAADELAEPVWFQFRLDATSMELLRIHATMRRVKPTVLISDLLNAWLGNATDYNQALIRELLPRGARAAPVPERFAGYLATLGYAPPVEEQIAPDPPNVPEGLLPRRADLSEITHAMPPDAPIELPPEPAPLIAHAPSEIPIGMNPDGSIASAPNPLQAEPGLTVEQAAEKMNLQVDPNPEVDWNPAAFGVGAFDPEAHAAATRGAHGHGNAAQSLMMGHKPAQQSPNEILRNTRVVGDKP